MIEVSNTTGPGTVEVSGVPPEAIKKLSFLLGLDTFPYMNECGIRIDIRGVAEFNRESLREIVPSEFVIDMTESGIEEVNLDLFEQLGYSEIVMLPEIEY